METTGTVRAYFLFFGLIGVLMHYSSIREAQEISWLPLIGLFLGISYVCVGLALRALLNRSAWLISSLLVAGLCYSFLTAFNRILIEDAQDPVGVLSRLVSAVFLTLYVINNVRRLAPAIQKRAEEAGNVASVNTNS